MQILFFSQKPLSIKVFNIGSFDLDSIIRTQLQTHPDVLEYTEVHQKHKISSYGIR